MVLDMWLVACIFSALAAGFILPTAIGLIRQVDGIGLVVIFNVLGLVTVGVGWLAAMILACALPKRLPRVLPYPARPAYPVYDGAAPPAYLPREHWQPLRQ